MSSAVVVDTMIASAWLGEDRRVAAVAIAAQLPLASEDSIFDNVPSLRRVDPND